MTLRHCLFVVADKNTEHAIRGFLERDQFHLSLRCGRFEFDPKHDLIVAVGKNDPGLYLQAKQYAEGARTSHRHLVIVLDAEWDGSPGAAVIRSGIEKGCLDKGWTSADVCVVVLDPEIEAWVWQDNPNVDLALGHRGPPSLRQHLAVTQEWPTGTAKPPRPKETLERVVRSNGVRRSSALYRQITNRVSIAGCVDPAFQHLVAQLRAWFPPVALGG